MGLCLLIFMLIRLYYCDRISIMQIFMGVGFIAQVYQLNWYDYVPYIDIIFYG